MHHPHRPPETERAFQAAVTQLAQYCGWHTFHAYDARQSTPGYPDLTLAKARCPLVLVELKSQGGRVSADQQRWLEVLQQTQGLCAEVWRPSDWERLTTMLQGEAPWSR